MLFIIVLLLISANVVFAQIIIKQEDIKGLTPEEQQKQIDLRVMLYDVLITKKVNTLDVSTDAGKQKLLGFLIFLEQLRNKKSNVTIDYDSTGQKALAEKDSELRAAIVNKLKEAGYDFSKGTATFTISGEDTKYDFRYLYEKDGHILKENFKFDFSGLKQVYKTGYNKWVFGTLGLILAIFLLIKRKKLGALMTWMKRRPRRIWAGIRRYAKHGLWKKMNGTYRRYDEFADRIKSLYEEKYMLIQKNLENVKSIDLPDEELANLYTREKKKFEHKWAKSTLARIEHINKNLLKEAKDLIIFAERELPIAEKEIIEHIEDEARRIKKFEAQLLETSELPGLGAAGKYHTYKDISGKKYIESGQVVKDEWGNPKVNAIGRFETTGKSLTEKNKDIHEEIKEIVQLTDIEKERIEKVMSPFMKNFLQFVQKLSSIISAEEKCIEIEMKTLEALHTGKVHPQELKEFRDVVKFNSEKKKEYYNMGANLMKEHFGNEKDRRNLEEWLDRIEHAREEKISHVEEQLSARVSAGDTFRSAKKPLPIKGRGLPQITDIYDLKIALERGMFDKVLEKREVIKEKILAKKRRIKTDEGIEEIPEEVEEVVEALVEDPIKIIGDWIDKDYGNRDLAEDVRRITEDMDWKQKRAWIVNAIEQRYKTWFGHEY